jgi:hypothetical protein
LYPFTILENIAFPTPGFSEAPITATDWGLRKIRFSSIDNDDDVNDDGEACDSEGIYKIKNDRIVINECSF